MFSRAAVALFLATFDNWTALLLLLGSFSLVGALVYLLMGEPGTAPTGTPGIREREPTF